MRCSETPSDLDVRFTFGTSLHARSLLRAHGNSAVQSLAYVYGHKGGGGGTNLTDIYRAHREALRVSVAYDAHGACLCLFIRLANNSG
jgi:hypothetical protein